MNSPRPREHTDSLTVAVSLCEGVARVEVCGEVDVATHDQLRAALARAEACAARAVWLDLSRLTFCDVAGCDILLRFEQDARASGHETRMLAVPSPLGRVMALLVETPPAEHLHLARGEQRRDSMADVRPPNASRSAEMAALLTKRLASLADPRGTGADYRRRHPVGPATTTVAGVETGTTFASRNTRGVEVAAWVRIKAHDMDFEILVEENSHNGYGGHDRQAPPHGRAVPAAIAHLAVKDGEVTLCVEPVDELLPVGGGHLHASDLRWCWVCKATAET